MQYPFQDQKQGGVGCATKSKRRDSGRPIRRNFNKGRIPAELAPIMERIGLSGELWCASIQSSQVVSKSFDVGKLGNCRDGSMLIRPSNVDVLHIHGCLEVVVHLRLRYAHT